ncbi:uncharacterized protein [Littorina saxatilis]|uniref:uncharacterized protein isoform X2 n=1 Tax=Littorina saxatilis TaxID=31220 RepID=UPI0038B5206D
MAVTLRNVRVKTLVVLIVLLATCFFFFGFKNPASAISSQLFTSETHGHAGDSAKPTSQKSVEGPPQQSQTVHTAVAQPPKPEPVTPKPLTLTKKDKFPKEYKSIEDEVEHLRQLAKELPDETEVKTLPAKDVQLYFHSHLDNFGTLCHRTVRLGTIFNGGYRVCDDEEYRPRIPCTVYSFGVKTDYKVEDEFSKLYGCHVYYFDPSLGENPTNRSERVALYKLGLGGKDGELEQSAAQNRDSKKWTTRSFTAIKTQLGHKDMTLDVVKLDIHGWEWIALTDMAASGELDKIRQLIVQFKNSGGTNAEVTRRRLPVLKALEKAGFKVFSTNLDEWGSPIQNGVYPVTRTDTYEISYVNTKLARADATPQVESTKPEAQDNGQPLPGVVNMEFLRTHGKERGGLPDEDQLKTLSPQQVHYAYNNNNNNNK